MTTALHLGDAGGRRFTIPADAVTQTFGIVAVRGAGKTNTSVVITEELAAAGHQVVVLDPLDVWWGLRASADGKSGGLPVYVFGGQHSDLPLDQAAGKVVADAIVEQGISAVLSLRHMSKSAQRRFVADFAERLYDRKGEAQYQTPLHLVIDEADAFAPQRVMADTARMLGAIDDCVRRGRNAGFGVTLITQRPATLHKDVLTQIEVLICLRTISPQDRKALDEWIRAHDSDGHRDAFMSSLASLQRGEAWVWSPGWIDVFERVQIRQRRTFDSSATPKAGEKREEPKRLAAIDIDALRDRLKTVVAEAEANDPKKLRARIAELERQMREAVARQVVAEPCNHGEEIARLNREISDLGQHLKLRVSELARVRDHVARAMLILDRDPSDVPPTTLPARYGTTDLAPSVKPKPIRQATSRVSSNAPTGDLEGITGGAMRMLERLAERYPETWTRAQLARLAKVKKSGGTFGTYFSRLMQRGLIVEEAGRVAITEHGLALMGGPPASPQTHDELVDSWRERLTGGARRMFDVLLAAGAEGLTRDELAAQAEIAPRGGTYGTYLSRLMTNGLVEKRGDRIAATDLLLGVS